MAFIKYATTWIAERRLSKTTRERYEGILRNHFTPTFGESAVADIKEATVRRWRSNLLDNGVGAPTVAKAYRLLRAIFTTVVEEDRMMKRNPCRIKGAGDDSSAERPVLTVSQVFALADAITPRYRMLVLLASFTTLRFGELAALRRRDVDLTLGDLHVRRSQAELKTGLIIKGPKSEAGKRTVAVPSVILSDVREHIGSSAEPGADGLVFVGPRGGQLRRRNFRRLWVKAVKDAKVPTACTFTTCATQGTT